MDVADQIIKVIDKLAEKFGIVVNTAQPNLEMLAHKIVNYNLYLSIISLIIYVVMIIAIYKVYQYIVKKIAEEEKDLEEGEGYSSYSTMRTNDRLNDLFIKKGFTTIVSIVLGIILFILMMGNIDTIVKCKLFPEQVVIEYVSDQYKKLK